MLVDALLAAANRDGTERQRRDQVAGSRYVVGWQRPGGRGIGTALLTALLAMADARGCRAVTLSVEDGNAARRLYERSGFVRVRRNGGSDTLVRTAAPGPGVTTA